MQQQRKKVHQKQVFTANDGFTFLIGSFCRHYKKKIFVGVHSGQDGVDFIHIWNLSFLFNIWQTLPNSGPRAECGPPTCFCSFFMLNCQKKNSYFLTNCYLISYFISRFSKECWKTFTKHFARQRKKPEPEHEPLLQVQ